jgi:hypothetical protein
MCWTSRRHWEKRYRGRGEREKKRLFFRTNFKFKGERRWRKRGRHGGRKMQDESRDRRENVSSTWGAQKMTAH